MVDLERLQLIREELLPFNATLVAVSKTKPVSDIEQLLDHDQLIFGENYVQELLSKHQALGNKPQWHFIGHLQSNKVKFLVPFIRLIHGVDSHKLLLEVNRRSDECGRQTDVLLQVHIAQEETKAGLDHKELLALMEIIQNNPLPAVRIRGLMGMATFTDDTRAVRNEFKGLRQIFDEVRKSANADFDTLSMGMSGDYKIALEEGSTMVRIGSLLFGSRK